MTAGFTSRRCVHCRRNDIPATERDHVIPDAWFPDSTPQHTQRWTVPACPKCNRELGKLEQDLLIRLALCVNPKSAAASGLAPRVFRSLGLDTEQLSENEKAHRRRLKTKLRSELIPYTKLAGKPGKIPGLGPPSDESVEWSVPIPWAALSIIAEKIARGCEYKLKRRFVEGPYGIRTFVGATAEVPEPFKSFVELFDFGPGCKIRRVFVTEDPQIVFYWISIWDTLNLEARIDLEAELKRLDQSREPLSGLRPEEIHGMRVPDYLRVL